ncbi:MAG: hypothetical protein ACTSRG_19690 [Candidatus Helarchaeota archaeon]
MEDRLTGLKKLFEDASKITLKDISISAENIGFEIRSGSGGLTPQIPIRVQYNNQTFTGIVLQNKHHLGKKE